MTLLRAATAAAAALSALLAGCTTIEPTLLSESFANQLNGQNVAIVIQEPSTFGVMLTRDVALGPLGIPDMNAQGAKLLADNHIGDPAEDIATLLGDRLAGRHGAVMLPARGRAATDEAATIVAAAPRDARYVLTVATVSWGVTNIPHPRSDYFVTYVARARLIERQTRAVMAEGGCLQMPDGTEYHGAAFTDFSADNAKLVKAELATRVERCIHFIQRDMLGL